MGIMSNFIGRLGLGVNPETGERVRTKSERCDDWNGTHRVVEEWNPVTEKWEQKGIVPGSQRGGHYN